MLEFGRLEVEVPGGSKGGFVGSCGWDPANKGVPGGRVEKVTQHILGWHGAEELPCGLAKWRLRYVTGEQRWVAVNWEYLRSISHGPTFLKSFGDDFMFGRLCLTLLLWISFSWIFILVSNVT